MLFWGDNTLEISRESEQHHFRLIIFPLNGLTIFGDGLFIVITQQFDFGLIYRFSSQPRDETQID